MSSVNQGMAMLYTLESEHYDSSYIHIDWEKLDACLRPTDRDAGGRLCGKRARAAAGKVVAGSEKAKKLAADIRAQKYGERGSSPAQIGAKAKMEARKAELAPTRKAAGAKAAMTKARKKAEVEYLANNPVARKALERRLNKGGGSSKLSERLKAAQSKQKVEGELGWEDLTKPKRRK